MRNDKIGRMISLDRFDHLLMADEWDRLGLQNLRALRLEVVREKEKIIAAEAHTEPDSAASPERESK